VALRTEKPCGWRKTAGRLGRGVQGHSWSRAGGHCRRSRAAAATFPRPCCPGGNAQPGHLLLQPAQPSSSSALIPGLMHLLHLGVLRVDFLRRATMLLQSWGHALLVMNATPDVLGPGTRKA
jgi:hypothetical protein